MGSDLLLQRLTDAGVSGDLSRARDAAILSGAPAELVEQHFTRLRNLAKYLRDFSAEQVAGHLQLLAALNEQQLVVVVVREGVEPGAFEAEVAGIDVRGASACVTGCLAEMGISIVQMDVVTWEPSAGGATSEAANAPTVTDSGLLLSSTGMSQLSSRYVMTFRLVADQRTLSAALLQAELGSHLKAAYWHLVRGDIQRARQAANLTDPLIGQLIDGRFRVERLLGEGGMGRIYLATQLELDRPVALKILRRDLTKDRVFATGFSRESRLMAQVRSPQVVQVYAAGMHDGEGWIAMEYLSGGDIAHWIGRHGVPPVPRAARWLRQALAGLQHIHEEVGIIHCDLKPSNLMLDAGQNVKIGDLGLSQLQHLSRLLGTDGRITGTLWYMSPEQASGGRLDERSDLFSLGSSFYHILAGRPPFDAATPAEVLARVARVDCLPLAAVAPHVPAGLATIIDRLMQSDPLRRYQDAAVASLDLESYLRRDRLGETPRAAAAGTAGETLRTPIPAAGEDLTASQDLPTDFK